MSENTQKKIVLGQEDYKKLLECNSYYVDKTLLVKDILDNGSKVILYARPRRFGKTLSLSMLNCFFNIDGSGKGLFDDCALARSSTPYREEQGKYPVISLSLKELRTKSFDSAVIQFREIIQGQMINFAFLLDSPKVNSLRKKKFEEMVQKDVKPELLTRSLLLLTDMLYEHYEQDTIVLIDEYDVPLDAGYVGGFYPEILSLIRALLSSTCKTNPHLRLSVHTGCLRIGGESIYTGFNNPVINTILSKGSSADRFGFTPAEVQEMLNYYGIGKLMPLVKRWYDGYLFGGQDIYNPWSILNFAQNAMAEGRDAIKPYWVNTSGNDLLLTLIDTTLDGSSARNDIERLLDGEPVVKTINENISYDELKSAPDAIWNILFFTGYLKPLKKPGLLANRNRIPLVLVNQEIREILVQKLESWYYKVFRSDASKYLVNALEENKDSLAEANFNQLLMRTVSFRDHAENFYHGFMAGLLAGVNNHVCKSNRESGMGLSDILFARKDRTTGIVIELKMSDSENDLERDAEYGYGQAVACRYVEELRSLEYMHIYVYGIACYKKRCKVYSLKKDFSPLNTEI